jgi:putative radical SAM enzyme (TIGR03279 family)
MAKKGIRIHKVEKRSAAGKAGLMPGDIILAVNGREVEDELALKFYLSEERVDLFIRGSSGREEHLKVKLPEGADLGIKVDEFRTRTCNNACMFCFVDQLPAGARQSLRVKDDDYRLSFLHGNYITLTNLSEKELDRVIEQRLSPLYVSVHATDPGLRMQIMGRKKPDDLNRKLQALVNGGIHIHAQIVLMPGINDGPQLEKTVSDLYGLYPGLQSVAIVPLGLSDYGKPKDRLAPVTPEFCRKVIRQARPWQKLFRSQTGSSFACLADEFYIQGKVDIPGADHYDDFAQIEDGVGMARSFLDEFETEMKRRRKSRSDLVGTIVTGRLFGPILRRCIRQFNEKFGSRLQVCEAQNRFLGRKITVAGLLSGQDILDAVRGKDIGRFLIVPSEALSTVEEIMLDGLSLGDLSHRLGKPVYPGGRTMQEFFRLLFEIYD